MSITKLLIPYAKCVVGIKSARLAIDEQRISSEGLDHIVEQYYNDYRFALRRELQRRTAQSPNYSHEGSIDHVSQHVYA